jgi:hypothetical protein
VSTVSVRTKEMDVLFAKKCRTTSLWFAKTPADSVVMGGRFQ